MSKSVETEKNLVENNVHYTIMTCEETKVPIFLYLNGRQLSLIYAILSFHIHEK